MFGNKDVYLHHTLPNDQRIAKQSLKQVKAEETKYNEIILVYNNSAYEDEIVKVTFQSLLDTLTKVGGLLKFTKIIAFVLGPVFYKLFLKNFALKILEQEK